MHEITQEMNTGHFWPMLWIRRGLHSLCIKGLKELFKHQTWMTLMTCSLLREWRVLWEVCLTVAVETGEVVCLQRGRLTRRCWQAEYNINLSSIQSVSEWLNEPWANSTTIYSSPLHFLSHRFPQRKSKIPSSLLISPLFFFPRQPVTLILPQQWWSGSRWGEVINHRYLYTKVL